LLPRCPPVQHNCHICGLSFCNTHCRNILTVIDPSYSMRSTLHGSDSGNVQICDYCQSQARRRSVRAVVASVCRGLNYHVLKLRPTGPRPLGVY
jgi:hypothetical protein